MHVLPILPEWFTRCALHSELRELQRACQSRSMLPRGLRAALLSLQTTSRRHVCPLKTAFQYILPLLWHLLLHASSLSGMPGISRQLCMALAAALRVPLPALPARCPHVALPAVTRISRTRVELSPRGRWCTRSTARRWRRPRRRSEHRRRPCRPARCPTSSALQSTYRTRMAAWGP